jgi:hypothetical protein
MEASMDSEKIRRRAHEKWESEGRPEGAHERHWFEAEAEENQATEDLPETWGSGGDRGVSPTTNDDDAETTSDAVPASGGKPGSFKPGELASENK